MTKLPIVEVEWVDSASLDGWRPMRDFTHGKHAGIAKCRTVGYLLTRDKRQAILVQSLGDDSESAGESMSIPAACIKRLRRLK